MTKLIARPGRLLFLLTLFAIVSTFNCFAEIPGFNIAPIIGPGFEDKVDEAPRKIVIYGASGTCIGPEFQYFYTLHDHTQIIEAVLNVRFYLNSD